MILYVLREQLLQTCITKCTAVYLRLLKCKWQPKLFSCFGKIFSKLTDCPERPFPPPLSYSGPVAAPRVFCGHFGAVTVSGCLSPLRELHEARTPTVCLALPCLVLCCVSAVVLVVVVIILMCVDVYCSVMVIVIVLVVVVKVVVKEKDEDIKRSSKNEEKKTTIKDTITSTNSKICISALVSFCCFRQEVMSG